MVGGQFEISKRGVSQIALNLTSKELLIDYMEFILGGKVCVSCVGGWKPVFVCCVVVGGRV
jgi:hypothetical protein